MPDYPLEALLASLPWSLAVVLVLAAVTAVIGTRLGRHNVADTTWGLLFAAVALVVAIAGDGYGDPVRRWVVFALLAVWGGRLAWHTGVRSRGRGEDPRYEKMLQNSGNRTLAAIVKIYLPQALLAWLIAAPVQVSAFESGGLGVLGVLGIALWTVGLFFETVGDAQMERYKAWKKAQPDDAVEGSVMDRGLWRYTRHPNYFGDACVWWGVFLIAAAHWPGVLTVPAPLIMTYLLTFGSGLRNLERSMKQRPGYPEYMRRTSAFIPLPPSSEPAGPNSARPSAQDLSLLR